MQTYPQIAQAYLKKNNPQELNTSDEEAMNNVFILARLPEAYFFGGDMADGTPEFTTIVSGIESHTDLIKQ